MARYSEEFKYSIMMKMMPPQNQSVSQVARETGLSEATLHLWRKQARTKGIAVPGGEQEAECWSTQDKFLIVLETATKSEVEMAEYCRSRGLFVEQVQAWRDACLQANGGVAEILEALENGIKADIAADEHEIAVIKKPSKTLKATLIIWLSRGAILSRFLTKK